MNVKKSQLALLVLMIVTAIVAGTASHAQAQLPYAAPRPLGVNVVSVNGGLQVNYVTPNSPAAYAGIRSGDIIISIAHLSVRYPTDIRRNLDVVLPYRPDGNVPIGLLTWQYDYRLGLRRVFKVTFAPFNGVGVPQYRN